MRRIFFMSAGVVLLLNGILFFVWPKVLYSLIFFGPLILLGIHDVVQKSQTIKKNFPVIGHFRYLLEAIRPEIQQYFIESNSDGYPFSREQRSVVYQRAKGQLDTLSFGTQLDVYREGHEWINHSLAPLPRSPKPARVVIGEGRCAKPYSASVFNISGMSYGALSKRAVLALNEGAKLGGFAHWTGEGGISPYHLEPGGDLVWQVGTGYFGCRTRDGKFDPAAFREKAQIPSVKMIELKLSQGAKPGHGGILPASKVTPEIVAIRGVEMGKDVISPPGHTAFEGPKGLLEFIGKLRELSGGKPVGFKLCLGKRREFFSICKAMLETGIVPDFITVDGSEGGTGAAPLEFANYVGTPLNEGLIFVHNALVGIGVRSQIKIIATGKVITGFNMAQKIALGADLCNSARGMMFALGCIQALRCNNNTCPTGIATQDPDLVNGIHVGDKAHRVAHYHKETVHSFMEVISAVGLSEPHQLRPWHIMRRVSSTEVKHYGEIYEYLEEGQLTGSKIPAAYQRAWEHASANQF